MNSQENMKDIGEGGANWGRSLRGWEGMGFRAAMTYLYVYFPDEFWKSSTASICKENGQYSFPGTLKKREREKTKIF